VRCHTLVKFLLNSPALVPAKSKRHPLFSAVLLFVSDLRREDQLAHPSLDSRLTTPVSFNDAENISFREQAFASLFQEKLPWVPGSALSPAT
jgi:hypothetical protein